MIQLVDSGRQCEATNDVASIAETATNGFAEGRSASIGKKEKPFTGQSGYPIGVASLLVISLGIYSLFGMSASVMAPQILLRLAFVGSGIVLLLGLYILHPNEAALLMLFGAYRGTDRVEGLRWVNPLCRAKKISLRAHSFNSDMIKVNDKRGNPIEIAAAVTWRVGDTAKAAFDVEDYHQFVHIQSEAAVRDLASAYAYDDDDETFGDKPRITLRSGIQDVNLGLLSALQNRFDRAGITVEDAKLTHLAYAPEIAGVMLRRQQAEAIIAARQKIVTGAVSMVEMALQALSQHEIVNLDDERKAAMVSNLMVVLCAEKDVQPVINAGTLYT